MSDSLRDQLIKAGLATQKQAKQAGRERHRDRQAKSPKRAEPSEQQRAVDQTRAAKAARDQALNRERQVQPEAKARAAEIRQLIEQHRIPKPETDEYFNFVDRKKVRRSALKAELRERLVRGDIAIARCEGRYDLVPSFRPTLPPGFASVMRAPSYRSTRRLMPSRTRAIPTRTSSSPTI
jgi:uncharacterized protein